MSCAAWMSAMGNKIAGTTGPNQGKPLDANRYATKKTIAQGMLDIALLTANASQLKYILQVGPRHEFYNLMLGLISTSIVLQVFLGVLFLSLNLLRDCRLHLLEYRASALIINYTALAGSILVTALNLLASGLDPGLGGLAVASGYSPPLLGAAAGGAQALTSTANQSMAMTAVASASFSVLAATIASRAEDEEASGSWTTWSRVFDHVALGLTMFRMVADITKMCFGLDPALPVLSGVICLMLGSSYNINKQHHHGGANMWNNVAMALNLVTTAVNVVISSFDMRATEPTDTGGLSATAFPSRFTSTCFNCTTEQN